MKEKTILIRARVVQTQEKMLTVKLDDGFANLETHVHQDNVLPDPLSPTA